jgi:hypothetical protein
VKKLTLVCAFLAIVGAALSTGLWHRLRAERVLASDLNAKVTAVEGRIGGAKVTPAPGTHAAPEATQPVLEEALESQPPAPHDPQWINREVPQDSESRKAKLSQLRDFLPKNYPGVIQALGLAPDQAEKFWNLLAENELESRASPAPTVNAQGDPMEALRAMGQAKLEADRKLDDSLTALLGESGVRQWQDYREHRTNRVESARLERSMEAAGLPLSNEQMRQVNAAMDAEQSRQRGSLTMPLNGSGAPDLGQLREERFRLQTERNSRIVEAMAPYLSAQQLDALRAALVGGLP